ncbi:PREDICTED: pro-opiomelanocortin [Ficedula albicollis]|uniref:Proopiomelanocortin n=2 Tax=Passeriformes TaxID=9126 RepID=U3JJT8_FICAL|nr:PREDICTED: pro-opiomelanocortin [Ficedula albicollis]
MGSGILPVVLGLILWNSVGASDPCRENSKCRDLGSEAGILACAGSCRAQLSLESPLFPGNGQFQPLSESLRRYVMSHFRWNQFGRKNSSDAGMRKREEGAGNDPGIPFSRRSEEAEKDGKRSYSMEHFRWGKPVGRKRRPVKVYPNGAEEESAENSQLEFRREEPSEEEEEEEEAEFPKFPWNSQKEKRYGGFMSPERIRTPLVTLFKNAIGKSFSKDGQ